MIRLIAEEVNLLMGDLLVGEMSKFLAIGWDSSPSPGFPINVYRDYRVKFWKIILLDTILY